MKFQKTLLAAALAAVSFGALAAVNQADVVKYANAEGDVLVKVEDANDSNGVVQNGWYKLEGNKLTAFTGETKDYTIVVSAGQVQITESTPSTTGGTTTGGLSFDGNVDQNNYWSFGGSTTTTTTTTAGTYTLEGQLVNTDWHGNNGLVDEKITFTGETSPATTATDVVSVKKDVQIGNITEEDRDTAGKAKYDFTLAGKNVQGTLATIKTEADANTAVAGVTGNGLAVLDVAKGGVVDLEKGTVTTTSVTGTTTTAPTAVLNAYDDKDGNRVVEFNGKYFKATDNTLTAYTGDTSDANLTKVGKGTADETTGGDRTTTVNTGLVSNLNVTYGESVSKAPNAGEIKISSTDPLVANDTSGNKYTVTSNAPVSTSTKDVKTGIIAVDEAGNKTYGLQATNTTDGKVTAQTTVTAAGIETTGDIAFVDAATGSKTSVKGYLEETSKAVDAKVDAALVEVDSRLTQFNSTAARLNSRIDDVEQTAYRGVAIALAAQQQIPNIGAGQFAVFGGVGHYEGETAGALGVASVFADGRTSLSAALGFAGGNEVGGRVGVSYVFGGK
ncbi:MULTISPECIES: YadA C-terminal domain-containing protein [unclassified Acinetobacter]|uniref:YadA-like family protein n=1 Tax=unclassified Acinetobacter TaxID=196816 RepID=UPI0015D1923C|nr:MULTISPECIES: YadA C-terminal domain-containing protein [unclassified Acinetobacter]UNW06300.1 YadA C-terminal domain-containing protein [Acinetobacter variabilis]